MTPVAEEIGARAWMCLVCGFVYYEALGLPEEGIPPDTPWEEIPDTWRCPDCGTSKADFVMSPL
jgi:rubredoxin